MNEGEETKHSKNRVYMIIPIYKFKHFYCLFRIFIKRPILLLLQINIINCKPASNKINNDCETTLRSIHSN